ncbi:hypothetical protein BB560_002429 [Smittium megazygosporum]|uniref:Essential protein Yae1 N-terminal domain-containing protein n=1 Tax=Smittium megazygosporum TaxID=133381 RepID=A0A2T9ZEV5_9FUNG|nr:hypothetical protein BB560_002429 [Smittium megazygosporum]
MGFREGIEVGKNLTMQVGFDKGLMLSITKFRELDEMLSKLQAFSESDSLVHTPPSESITELKFVNNLDTLLPDADDLISELSYTLGVSSTC